MIFDPIGGYVIVYGDGPAAVLDGLANRDLAAYSIRQQFQRLRQSLPEIRTRGGDLLPGEALGIGLYNAGLPSDLATDDPMPLDVALLASQTEPRSRWFVLFYLVRRRAYEIKRDRGFVRLRWLRDHARSLNRLMPQPLGTLPDDEPDEPADVARKVHAWIKRKTWTSEAQSTRARLTRPGARKLDDRQADDLLRDHDDGMSLRAIAGKYGVGLAAVRGALARAAAINAGPVLF